MTSLRRPDALVPPPYAHLIRCYGLVAVCAEGRELLPSAPVGHGLGPSVALRADLHASANPQISCNIEVVNSA